MDMANIDSITTIDCCYGGEEKQAAAYLLIEDGRAAFIDNNTTHAVPRMLEALRDNGLTPEQVDYVIITHVHLDHAGGSAALMDKCPNASLLAHPRAARHVIDPSRLVASSIQVYGEEKFRRLYGDIHGIDSERVRTVEDGEEIHWGGRTLRFLHTLGHAKHHMCIQDTASNSVFTGDAFGVGCSTQVRAGTPFLVCSCTPTHFDAEDAKKSVDLIVATGADRAYVTHYGYYEDLAHHARQLHHSLDQMAAILAEAAETGLEGEDLDAFCRGKVSEAFAEHLKWCGSETPDADLAWLGSDVVLNAMGLAFLAQRQRAVPPENSILP